MRILIPLMLCLLTGSVQAETISVNLGGSQTSWNQIVAGDGFDTMTPGGQQADKWGHANPNPGWLDEWFHDGETVDVAFTYSLLNGGNPGGVDVSVAWANDRTLLGQAWLIPTDSQPRSFSASFVLPYNPEWVSVGIAGYNVSLSGSFTHVPELGTFAEFAVAAVLLGTWTLVCRCRRK